MTLPHDGPNRVQVRLWPGIVAVILQWFAWFAVPVFSPDAMIYGMAAGAAGALFILVWWIFFNALPWHERLGAIVLMAVALAATPRILDKSVVNGMMGMMFMMSVIPFLSLALVVGTVACRYFTTGTRRAAVAAAILLACGGFALVRTDGITGEGRSQLAWRWAKTSEQKLLEKSGGETATLQPASAPKAVSEEPGAKPSTGERPGALRVALPKGPPPVRPSPVPGADWPGFRGPHRDGTVSGVRIKTDWNSTPPVELWRRPVGPGWSSFAVHGGLLYTQEQRGDFEVVSCYNASTGEPVWTHRDAARFWESNGGAGPRGTPTIYGGRVYTFGATGILNALDAGNGAVIWTRNAPSDTGAKPPEWGFASSPLVMNDLVIVATSGRLAAYDLATGNPHWLVHEGGIGYSSPQLATINGVEQILLSSGAGTTSFAPTDGKVLWTHSWPGFAPLQPAVTGDSVLVTTGDTAGGAGTRRLAVTHRAEGWKAEEVWTSTGLKPYFNDFVIHDGHVFGFDGGILACIDLQDGKRNWKGGRYGHGQLLLLADQDLLLVLSEEGELALVSASPGQFTEIAKFPAMDGKTWNHPVLAGDILFVRNGQEMVAFRLSLDGV